MAIEAIQRFDPRAVKINTYDEIRDYGGGTLVLAEFYNRPDPGKSKGDGPYEYQVLVKDGRGAVYQDWSQTLRQGSRGAEIISKMSSPDVVTAVLTFVLVAAYIALVGILPLHADASQASAISKDASQALGGALTTVLGFWFGRQSSKGR